MQALEKRAYAANVRLIISPADKIAVVYFSATHGTNANSRHVFGDRLRDPNWRFTLCTARSMPSNNAKRLLSCCFVVAEYL